MSRDTTKIPRMTFSTRDDTEQPQPTAKPDKPAKQKMAEVTTEQQEDRDADQS